MVGPRGERIKEGIETEHLPLSTGKEARGGHGQGPEDREMRIGLQPGRVVGTFGKDSGARADTIPG